MRNQISYHSTNFQSILNKYPNFYRNSGLAFWTETNFKQYLEYLQTTYPDKERFELILDRIIIGRKLRIQFYSLVAAVASICLAVLCSTEGRYLWSAITGCMFFIGLKLAINAIELDNTTAFSTIYRLRFGKQTKNIGKINATINGRGFSFSQKEVLIIEYFRFLTKEGEHIVHFGRENSAANKNLIINQLQRNWSNVKKSMVRKLLTKDAYGTFKFLKNIKPERLESINSYFVVAELPETIKIFNDTMLK